MAIKTVGVVGAGTMGSGIAQACASAGLRVILRDIDQRYLDASLTRMEQSMSRLVEKGKLTAQDRDSTLSRIQTTVELGEMAQAELIIEAALEDPALKKNIFSELNNICPAETVFASNTSSLSITDIASGSGRPDRFCGIHFFNPVSVMRLVEIISGLNTSETTVEKAFELVRAL
ncbi:3-hydroxybutyryl-CoA dehydrogenase [bioreactor metagenome]|uniref:3-hydroxybutyryl-CoA dehydrogenase n=1 Tax=bioreactor metagenome TaxID=1076179 RepID=A0A644ZG61_9ZZZZ